MDQHSLAVLEYARVLELVRRCAPGSLGAARLGSLEPSAVRDEVLGRQRETTQMRALRERHGGLPWSGSQDLSAHLGRLRAEHSWIEGRALNQVADFALAAGRIRGAILPRLAECPDLARHAAEIPELGGLAQRIRGCLTPEGELRDEASDALGSLRRDIGRTRREVISSLERLMEAEGVAEAIQERIVTLREDRYVVPVKAGGRGAVPGLVHDRSATGQTFFVEPQGVVELNNALRELVLAEREEVLRILRDLADGVRMHAADLRAAAGAMGELEAIWARAAYADERDLTAPEIFPEEGRLELRAARHPLLVESLGARVVPVDVAVGEGTRTVVLTGPNTGGKTVVLKTVGLLCLMAQSGMHLPAAPGSGVSCFEEVLADIGDEQSLEQNLSTFSGHLRNVVQVLERARPGALVLLDELGAGTDPAEGAALGVSLLEEVQRRGAITLATTHHQAVKVYASATPGVQNAAMEFDERTLRPTFRVLAGVPGRSQAFAIAERLGIPREVIARAREHQGEGEVRLDRLMDALEREREQAAHERRELAAARLAADRERRRGEEEVASLRRKWEQEREKLRRETRGVLRAAEREVGECLRGLRAQPGAAAAEKAREAARRLERAARDGLALPEEPRSPAPEAVSPGERVFVVALQAWGTVQEAGPAGAVVLVGDKRVSLPLGELSRRGRGGDEGRVERRAPGGRYTFRVPEIASTQLDLRGLRAEEALGELERFLDAAVLNHLAEVSILHGKGTGRLQEAVRQFLATDRRVESFAFAPLEQGGAGVSKVRLAL